MHLDEQDDDDDRVVRNARNVYIVPNMVSWITHMFAEPDAFIQVNSTEVWLFLFYDFKYSNDKINYVENNPVENIEELNSWIQIFDVELLFQTLKKIGIFTFCIAFFFKRFS